MYCMNCGQQLPPDAVFCPNCGQKLETSSNKPPADTSEQANGVDGGAPDRIESCMNYALVITGLALFQCGTYLNLVLGIAAIVFASKVDQNLLSGNREKAEECAHTAKMLCMVATGVIVFQILFVFLILAAILACAVLPVLLH